MKQLFVFAILITGTFCLPSLAGQGEDVQCSLVKPTKGFDLNVKIHFEDESKGQWSRSGVATVKIRGAKNIRPVVEPETTLDVTGRITKRWGLLVTSKGTKAFVLGLEDFANPGSPTILTFYGNDYPVHCNGAN